MIYAFLALMLTAFALLFYAAVIEPARLTIRLETLVLQGLEKPVKIAAIADLHAGFGGMNDKRIAKIAAAIQAQSPDIVVFLGDLFENYRRYSHGREQEIARALTLHLPEGTLKLAVFGNHDSGGNAENAFREIFQLAGWTVLVNESIIYGGVNIIGSDEIKYGKPDIRALITADMSNIVLVHEPDCAKWLQNVQLQLSGHTHAGQVRLPFFGALKLPTWGHDYVYGMHKKPDGGSVFVTRGLGMSTLPLRFLAPPEIALITLEPDNYRA